MNSRLVTSTSIRISLFSSARRHAIIPRWSTRNIHVRRPLAYPLEEGLGNFLPPAALKTLAVEYQDGLLERLNDQTRGTDEATLSVAQTVINTASKREKALAFHYASEALNNSFFLDFLKPPPPPPATNHEDEISPYLGTAIRHYEGSVGQLISRVNATAMGMSTSGYVWFVTDQSGYTAVVPTYGSGTLLVRSRTQHSPAEGLVIGEHLGGVGYTERPKTETGHPHLATASETGPHPTSPTSGLSHAFPPPNPLYPTRTFHTTRPSPRDSYLSFTPTSLHSDDPSTAMSYGSNNGTKFDFTTLGETLFPLFCVSVHEHAWLSAGYGIWGKEKWLREFWTVLDWQKVSQAYVKWVPNHVI